MKRIYHRFMFGFYKSALKITKINEKLIQSMERVIGKMRIIAKKMQGK